MKKILALISLLFASDAYAAAAQVLTPEILGVNNIVLADADGANVPAQTTAINMAISPQEVRNQLALFAVVNWGTSTRFYTECEESADATYWGSFPRCDGSTVPGKCKKQTTYYDSVDWPDGRIAIHIPNAGVFMRCKFWDPALGTGTITLRGNRSVQ